MKRQATSARKCVVSAMLPPNTVDSVSAPPFAVAQFTTLFYGSFSAIGIFTKLVSLTRRYSAAFLHSFSPQDSVTVTTSANVQDIVGQLKTFLA